MELHIKQRLFSWGDGYYVYDNNGEARYEVRSALFSLGHQIHVYDICACESQEEVGCIRQKLFALLPTFEIQMGGRTVGTIRKHFTMLRQNYEVDCMGWTVEGNFLGWDYRVLHGNTEVMTITKEIWHFTDTYTLRFSNPADAVMGLLLVVAIDAANCSHND